MQYLGNKQILANEKIGLLCSRKVPANIILKTYDWAIEQREKKICIVSGFHSKIEKDVFDILIKGEQPIIVVLARSMYKRFNQTFLKLIAQDRLLIVSPFNKNIPRSTIASASRRNEYITEISDKLFIPYSTPGGLVDNIKQKYSHKIITI